MSSGTLAAIAIAGFVVWMLGAILVAEHAESEGFRRWQSFLVALFLGWPLVLAMVLTFGRRSPMLSELRELRGDILSEERTGS